MAKLRAEWRETYPKAMRNGKKPGKGRERHLHEHTDIPRAILPEPHTGPVPKWLSRAAIRTRISGVERPAR